MKYPPTKTSLDVRGLSETIFKQRRIALFVVAYNAEKHIRKTLSRIPDWCRPLFSEIYIIDDSSRDNTFLEAVSAGKSLRFTNLSVMKTPQNQGYGGNQKIGYTYAIKKNYDIVILLHGDGQYPPESIPEMVVAYADQTVDAVFGSRMINKKDALRGGMPLYKWIGNQVLTSIENKILETSLSEFHSGYRSYKTNALRTIPFHLNSDDFHFDTDIIIQLVLQKSKILEIPMPTHYGDEKCHVNGMRYAGNCLRSAIKSRLHQAGVFFQPNFEITTEHETRNYQLKKATTSLHHFILEEPWRQGLSVIDLGANDGLLSKEIATKGAIVTAIDINIPREVPGIKTIQADLNQDLTHIVPPESADAILALDVIEHLSAPEYSAEQIHHVLKSDGRLYASTANIGYIVMRLTLLLGWFNYGKKGILDRTHHRLFTIGSFKRLIKNAGFDILKIEGFGPPILDAFGNTPFWRTIDSICYRLAKIYPRLFAFNFLIIAKKRMSVREKTQASIASRQKP